MLLLLLATSLCLAQNIVLDNRTAYPSPDPKSEMAIQWAGTAKEVEDDNIALMHGMKQNPDSLQPVQTRGKVPISSTLKAAYFRVLVWTKDSESPDLHTSWIQIAPDTTYILNTDDLVPSVLISGSGC